MDEPSIKSAERDLAEFPFPRKLERLVLKVQRSFVVHEGRRQVLTHGSDVTVSSLRLSWVQGLGFVPQSTDRFVRVLVNGKWTSGVALLPDDMVEVGSERFRYEAE